MRGHRKPILEEQHGYWPVGFSIGNKGYVGTGTSRCADNYKGFLGI